MKKVIMQCLLMFLCMSMEAQEWKISISKNKETLTLEETLEVRIDCAHPPEYTPNLTQFFTMQKQDLQSDNFLLVSSKYRNDPSHLSIFLTLKPLFAGTLIYAPGVLSFTPTSSQGKEVTLLVPALSIECRRLFTLVVAPPLPVYPEKSITISKENKNYILQEELAKETVKNQELNQTRMTAWTIFTLVLSAAFASLLIFWFLAESDLLRAETEKLLPHKKRNFKEEFASLTALDISFSDRFRKLSLLLRDFLSAVEKRGLQGKTNQELIAIIEKSSVIQEKEALKELLSYLESIEFSKTALDKADWEKALTAAHSIVY